MESSKYWEKRIVETQDKIYNMSVDEIDGELKKYYKKALDETEKELSKLYDEIMKETADGIVRPNDLYKYGRIFRLNDKIKNRLNKIGEKEQDLFRIKFTALYNDSYEVISNFLNGLGVNYNTSFEIEQAQGAEIAVKSTWCADSKHWSTRIWRDKTALQEKLEKGILDCIVRGVSKDKLVEELNNTFNSGFKSADRIARTELTYVQNKAAKDRYMNAGVTEYKFLAEIDNRTSDICKELNGKIFKFTDSKVGENFPPCHVRCRSTIVPVIK